MNYVIGDSKLDRCKALQSALQDYPEIHFRGSFSNASTLLAEVCRLPPDIAFIYIGNKDFNAFSAAEHIRVRAPDTRIVFLSEIRDYALPAFEIGVDNYLLLPLDKMRLHNMLQNLMRIR